VRYPTLVGHRGLAGQAQMRLKIPENSQPAWEWADRMGADVLDVDVLLTEDLKMVVMHDATLDRTTTCSGRVDERYLSTIKACWLELPDGTDTDYHPLSLRQALTYLKTTGKWLTIELKGSHWTSARVEKYRDELRYHSIQDRTITHARNNTVLGNFKALAPTYPRASVVYQTPLTSVSTVKSRGGYVFVRLSLATKDYVSALQLAGVKVFVWTLNTPEEFEAALATGAYGWVCDAVDDAKGWLDEHGA
jgi:glycerophosphoryl diester phosphodiesterase